MLQYHLITKDDTVARLYNKNCFFFFWVYFFFSLFSLCLVISFQFLSLFSLFRYALSSSNLKLMEDMNTITKPPWPNPLSLVTTSHLTQTTPSLSSIHGSWVRHGSLKSGVGYDGLIYSSWVLILGGF